MDYNTHLAEISSAGQGLCNWVAMVIIGHDNLGKFGSGEGCFISRDPHDHVLEVLDYYH